jgi:hypothetical protein
MHFRSDRVQSRGEFYIARRMVLVGANNRPVKTKRDKEKHAFANNSHKIFSFHDVALIKSHL